MPISEIEVLFQESQDRAYARRAKASKRRLLRVLLFASIEVIVLGTLIGLVAQNM